MRSDTGKSTISALVLMAVAVGFASPAFAGLYDRDHVYADSFGNLVIESATGYKRIIVGEGKLAKQLSDYTGAGQPAASSYDYESDDSVSQSDCYRPPVFVKGRSYMYGLSDGEMPQISPCR